MLSKRTVNAGNGTLESERPFPVTASNLSAALGGCISTSFARANYSKSRVVNWHSTGELAVSAQVSPLFSCILDITRVVIKFHCSSQSRTATAGPLAAIAVIRTAFIAQLLAQEEGSLAEARKDRTRCAKPEESAPVSPCFSLIRIPLHPIACRTTRSSELAALAERHLRNRKSLAERLGHGILGFEANSFVGTTNAVSRRM